MKPFIEKLQISDNSSFYACKHANTLFEAPWHKHLEYELISFQNSQGLSFIGSYVGEFNEKDIFFICSDVPHLFENRDKKNKPIANVIQFDKNSFGEFLLKSPECNSIRDFIHQSMSGIKIKDSKVREVIRKLIEEIISAKGLKKTLLLFECLEILSNANENELEILTSYDQSENYDNNTNKINKVLKYTVNNFNIPISLDVIAKIANMSVPNFCKYFKTSTKKTYIDYLNEIRIGHACNLLTSSDMTIYQVAYSSGYNSVANFNKQFVKIKKIAPSKFKKQFLAIKNKEANLKLDTRFNK